MSYTPRLPALALALAACRGPAPAAAARPPDPQTVDRFFAAIEKGNAPPVEAMLEAAPGLASASNEKGHSAFLVALFQEAGESFVRPQDNAVLGAILARHPVLDPIEAAATDDRARIDAELANDPGYVRRVHAVGWAPLHFAAFGGQSVTVTALLAHGADIDARARNKIANTPLQVALLTAQGDVVRILLSHGADVNAKQGEGFTALHEAALNGDVEIVKLLLDAGADLTVRGGTKHESALDMAVSSGHADAAALLRTRDANLRH